MVIFNASTETKTQAYDNADLFELHPVQAKGVDSIVKKSTTSKTGFTVPGLSTAVFVLK